MERVAVGSLQTRHSVPMCAHAAVVDETGSSAHEFCPRGAPRIGVAARGEPTEAIGWSGKAVGAKCGRRRKRGQRTAECTESIGLLLRSRCTECVIVMGNFCVKIVSVDNTMFQSTPAEELPSWQTPLASVVQQEIGAPDFPRARGGAR